MVNLGDRFCANTDFAKISPFLRPCSSLILGALVSGSLLLPAAPSSAAEKIVVHSGIFESSLPVADLRNYAQTQRASPSLSFFLQFVDKAEQPALRDFLQKEFAVNPAVLSKVLEKPAGRAVLEQVSPAIVNSHGAGIQALRAAAVLGTKPEGMSVLSVLDAYPNQRIVMDVPKALTLIDSIYPDTPTDRIAATPLWQMFVDYQITVAQNQPQAYSACLFGDSISSALGNTLGNSVYNFALGGLSTVSLVEQLKQLNANSVQCRNAVIAIGANDALYKITDDQFVQNLTQAINLVKQMGAERIVLLPAFYSTLAASKNPRLAGPIPRVEAINQLIQQVAETEGLDLKSEELTPLFDGKTLKKDLTSDGVHLNTAGLKLYRPIILNILGELT